VANIYNDQLAESQQPSDSSAAIGRFGLGLSDSQQPSDSSALGFGVNTLESQQSSDSSTASGGRVNVDVSDSQQPSDLSNASGGRVNVDISESPQPSDSSNARGGKFGSDVGDGPQPLDSLDTGVKGWRTLSDSQQPSDSIDVGKVQVRDLSESSQPSDSTTHKLTAGDTVGEFVAPTDAATFKQSIANNLLAELATPSDSASCSVVSVGTQTSIDITISGTVIELAKHPTADFTVDSQFPIVGSVIRLDGYNSSDPLGKPLYYTWTFLSVPIGSQVGVEGFKTLELETDSQSPVVVSFSPDLVGEYVLSLKVSNGVYESETITNTISVRAIMVPHGRGLVPDGKFLWTYIRDAYAEVSSKEWFETLWSALIQICGSELLKLYQVDYNKSIRDIQERYQRRWLKYEPRFEIDQANATFFLDEQQFGYSASTKRLGISGAAIILGPDQFIVVEGAVLPSVAGKDLQVVYSKWPANKGHYTIQSVNTSRTGYRITTPYVSDYTKERVLQDAVFVFNAGDTVWTLLDKPPHDYPLAAAESGSVIDQLTDLYAGIRGHEGSGTVAIGDIIVYAGGPNAGLYRILDKAGTYFTVDKQAVVGSDANIKADIYHPVGIKVEQDDVTVGGTFMVPYRSGVNDLSSLASGRLVVVGGRAFTVVRSQIDRSQSAPITVVTSYTQDVPTDVVGMDWRAPHTLASLTQNFEELGVSNKDRLLFDLVVPGTEISIEIPAQVVGVDGYRLAFVLTDQPVLPGEIAEIPNNTYLNIADALNLPGVTLLDDGTLTFTGMAKDILSTINSPNFRKQYFNTELTPYSTITVNGISFLIRPKAIIRNRMIPLDTDIVSIPLLQEYIKQPNYQKRDDGTFVIVRDDDREHLIPREPVYLGENVDYIIDNALAFDGKLTFQTGYKTIDADTADFYDRNIAPGDTFSIIAPYSIAGDYIVESVVGIHRIKLTRATTTYLNQIGSWVTAHVRIIRRRAGHFLRFVPDKFTAATPAPSRLWAEVTFFDNNQAIEDNFGLLVGVTREDLEKVSSNATYRQVIAGLMYALTKGSAISKIESGVKILLGLPYAEHDGVIRSIEKDYRLAPDGTPLFGRLLVEDVDGNKAPLGTVRVYTYPIDLASTLSGIETNPATGLEYVVGDTIYRLNPLAKGVEVRDYTTDPITNGSLQGLLQQFQSFKVRVNNNIFSTDELSLVSEFLRRISPSYVAYVISISNSQMDEVDVGDFSFQSIRLGNGAGFFADNTCLGLQYALAMDQASPDGAPAAILSEDGFFELRRFGKDLATTASSSTATSATGGLLDPNVHESFDAPLCGSGDRLYIFRGDNKGIYTISSATNTTVTVSDAPLVGFRTASNQRFAVLRKLKSLRMTATNVTVTSGNASIPLGQGAVTQGVVTQGVMHGDWVIPSNTSLKRRYVVTGTPVDIGTGHFYTATVTPTPAANVSSDFIVVRPQLLESPWPTNFTVVSGGTNTVTEATHYLRGLADVGDTLFVPASGISVEVLDPANLYVTPALSAGTYTVQLKKANRTSGPVDLSTLDFNNPADSSDMSLGPAVATTATCHLTAVVDFPNPGPYEMGARPGDQLVLIGGTNGTVDVGYGAGVYPIVGVTTLHVTLSVVLTAAESLNWKLKRTR
jgi:hypothetical protein